MADMLEFAHCVQLLSQRRRSQFIDCFCLCLFGWFKLMETHSLAFAFPDLDADGQLGLVLETVLLVGKRPQFELLCSSVCALLNASTSI